MIIFTLIILFFVVITFFILKKDYFSGDKKKKVDVKKDQLIRTKNNPVFSPDKSDWRAQGTFNPAAIKDSNNNVHLLYRALGMDGVSRLGHAESPDGKNFDSLPYPVFSLEKFLPKNAPEDARKFDLSLYPSGGSWIGIEDPRMVSIDGRIYVTFNAFDGWDFVRVGVISIKEEDFFKKQFSWSKPLFISPKNKINKNWVLFPEKINGKFAILHSITPHVQIEYVDNIENIAYGGKEIKSIFGQKKPREEWDTWVRSAGPPPLKTEKGWLIFYHATNKDEPHQYKLGAMLLDIKDPEKIIARSPTALMSPDMWYENDWKPGVIYVCGAIIQDENIRLYYGGGDKYVCTAEAKLKPFLDWLVSASEKRGEIFRDVKVKSKK
ncbi:MAG: hypothetical protein WCV55_03080 [Candidatus Paceibacterota bacterium]